MISDSGNDPVIGPAPRISIDSRIRRPHAFASKNPPPPPPTMRYAEIACGAAAKIMAAMWFCRQYIEVIKVWYSLDDSLSNNLYIIGEVVLVVPITGEKIVIKEESLIGSRFAFNGMGFGLTGTDVQYDAVLEEFSSDLVRKSKNTINDMRTELKNQVDEIQLIQDIFAETL